MNRMLLKFSLFAILLTSTVFGQSAPPPQGPSPLASDQPDPEDRTHGVARISLMNGDVSVRRGDSGDFVAGNINAPLISADSIQTGPASRAEVEFDSANRIRLGSLSEIRIGDLRTGVIQVQVARGTATFTQIAESQAEIEFSSPSAAFKPLRRGAYRLTILEDGTTQFTIRAGEADVFTQSGTQHLQQGLTMLLRGSGSETEYQLVGPAARDEWDQFNETRDRELARSVSYQHVSRDVTGASDLDQYGRWNTDPTYGDVWVPNVAADWAPYQSGRWVWEDYYGWTWVSYDPWGWAPYHYGRWYRGAFGWGWVPGPIYARAFYRPALVGFFGIGSGVGFGFGFGFGSLGWVALAPFEAYHPWYGRGFIGGGFSHVNVVNNVNIYNTYRNARVPNGAMSMTAQQFQGGQFGHYAHPGIAQLQTAGAVHGQLPVAPTANHLQFNARSTSVTNRVAVSPHQFPSRGGFAQVQRQSFAQQRQAVQQSITAPRYSADLGQGRSAVPAGRGIPPSGASGGWQRFGAPSNPSPGIQSAGSSRAFGTASAPSSNYGTSNRNYAGSNSSTPYSGRSVQIAPSIVQQRPSAHPSSQGRQSGPGSSGVNESRPSSGNSGNRSTGSHATGSHQVGPGKSNSAGNRGR